jgi:16S rRNA processing protein RimM
MAAARRFLLGRIATAHGVRGLVKILALGEDPVRLETCGPAWTAADGGKPLKLTMKNPLGKYYLAEVEGIADRDAAEKLRHTELWIDRDKLPAADDGEFYHSDLLELPVFDTTGKELGRVIAVENYGASDLLEIKPQGAPSFYIPFTDETVTEITDDHIVVFIPEGLLE